MDSAYEGRHNLGTLLRRSSDAGDKGVHAPDCGVLCLWRFFEKTEVVAGEIEVIIEGKVVHAKAQ